MDKNLLITQQTSPEEVKIFISKLREQKGKENETLKLINEALSFGHQFVVNLFFEEALTNQHLYMNDNSNKGALIDMQNSVLKAGFYIKKYNLDMWLSRYFRFLGRIEDYKKNFKKSISYYKKAIKYVEIDPEPFRVFELEGFLAFAIIMSGQVERGFKYSKKVYAKYLTTKVGINLKQKDYFTWEVWRSGVAIRTITALLDLKYTFNLKDALLWLNEVKIELNKKEYDFSYRKIELTSLKERLKLN
jgi:tetratricopeptide (TPR) repeat protein